MERVLSGWQCIHGKNTFGRDERRCIERKLLAEFFGCGCNDDRREFHSVSTKAHRTFPKFAIGTCRETYRGVERRYIKFRNVEIATFIYEMHYVMSFNQVDEYQSFVGIDK